MYKKYFLGMLAAAGMLLATSCSNDELIEQGSGDMATVSFNLTTEGAPMSRAISDGKSADKLVYAVFDKEGTRISGIQRVTKTDVTFPVTESLSLAKGQTYKVAFWAQNKDCNAYTVEDDMNVTVGYDDASNNDDTRDAFFKTVEFTVNGDASIDVELKRPFAQINVGVTQEDWENAVASGIEIAKSSVKINSAAKKINLLTGKVEEATEVTYNMADVISDENLMVDGTNYKWLSMCYILVHDQDATSSEDGVYGANKTTLDKLAFEFHTDDGSKSIKFEEGLNGVPVQRNYRTNIVGRILTGSIDFNISIDNEFEDGDHKQLNVTPEELKTILTASENVTLAADYVVSGDWTPIKISGAYTLDGAGHTISGLTDGLFRSEGNDLTVKNLNVANSNLNAGSYNNGLGVGAIVNYSDAASKLELDNCHAVDVTVNGSEVEDACPGCGVLVGFSDAATTTIKNCSVKNSTVAGHDGNAAGIIGMYGYNEGLTVENCTVENITLTAQKSTKIGKIIGSVIDGSATLNSNTCNDENYKIYGRIVRGTITIDGVAHVTAAQLNAALSPDENGNITLDKDYVLVDAWTPANCGSSEKPIVINGNGHSISGLTAALLCDNYNLGSKDPITVKNLTIKDSEIAAGYNASGAIIAYINQQAGLTLENCHLVNSTVGCGYDLQTGGLVGMVTNMDMTIKDCSVKNSTINGGSSGAGIVGQATTETGKTMTIENCSVTGSTITSADNGDWRVGAMVGTVNGTGKLTVSGCTADATNTFTQDAGADKSGYEYGKVNHIWGRATASGLIEVK